MPEQNEIIIPPATTIGELNTHIGYMRVEISKATTAIANIGKKIDDLDDHYTTEQEFRPVADLVAAHDLAIKDLTASRDTLNGKLIALGAIIIILVPIFIAIINHYWH